VKAIVIGSLAMGCMTTIVQAQETKESDKERRSTESTVKSDVQRTSDSKSAQVMLHRASEVHGMKVRNTANKELGSIKDTIVDVRPGKIRYAALSYGGFLGLGDKVFAVPWDALQHRHDVSSGDSYFVLDIDEATLKRSEGFDD
jgi:sporulation protein YlmC with PRC-barrel domain